MTEGRAPRFWLCYDVADALAVRRDCSWLQELGFRFRMSGAAGTPALARARADRCAAVLLYLPKTPSPTRICARRSAMPAGGKPIVVVRIGSDLARVAGSGARRCARRRSG